MKKNKMTPEVTFSSITEENMEKNKKISKQILNINLCLRNFDILKI